MPNDQTSVRCPQSPTPNRQTLILASSSPRRRELLAEAGYQFVVVPPREDVECGVCSESGPAGLVAELAYRKAKAVRDWLLNEHEELVPRPTSRSALPNVDATGPQCSPKHSIVLAADTVAELDGLILGKPNDEDAAGRMLQQLSGREHRVLTGVCLWPLVLPLDCCNQARGTLTPNPAPSGKVEPVSLPLGECQPTSLPLPLGEGRGEGASPRKSAPPHEGAPPRPHAQRVRPDLLRFARTLRQSQTNPEQFIWRLLRNRRFGGFKFRRQYPLDPYILDFYCHDRMLAIELDGGQHNTDEGRRADVRRSRYIADRGIRVLRFWNHEVFQDTDAVLEAIWNALQRGQCADAPNVRSQARDSLTPNPSPSGRGEPVSLPLGECQPTSLLLPLGEGRGEGASPPTQGLAEGLPLIRVAVTKLRMDPLSDAQLNEYLTSGQWEGKAGAFGYQDRLGWVHVVEGSESNVVGLPMELLAEMLLQLNERHPTTREPPAAEP